MPVCVPPTLASTCWQRHAHVEPSRARGATCKGTPSEMRARALVSDICVAGWNRLSNRINTCMLGGNFVFLGSKLDFAQTEYFGNQCMGCFDCPPGKKLRIVDQALDVRPRIFKSQGSQTSLGPVTFVLFALSVGVGWKKGGHEFYQARRRAHGTCFGSVGKQMTNAGRAVQLECRSCMICI